MYPALHFNITLLFYNLTKHTGRARGPGEARLALAHPVLLVAAHRVLLLARALLLAPHPVRPPRTVCEIYFEMHCILYTCTWLGANFKGTSSWEVCLLFIERQ